MRLSSRFLAATFLIGASASAAKFTSAEGEEDALLRDATVAIERARVDLIGVRRDLHTSPNEAGLNPAPRPSSPRGFVRADWRSGPAWADTAWSESSAERSLVP